MGYKSSQQTSLTFFKTYFLPFGHEPKLLALIQCNVMVIINLDDLNVWL
jgi:hypothetical protein